MIRVTIVEDEMLVRLGLRMCLESSPDIYVAGAFASAEEAETGQPAMDLSRDKNAEEMKWSPLEMGAAMQAHGA